MKELLANMKAAIDDQNQPLWDESIAKLESKLSTIMLQPYPWPGLKEEFVPALEEALMVAFAKNRMPMLQALLEIYNKLHPDYRKVRRFWNAIEEETIANLNAAIDTDNQQLLVESITKIEFIAKRVKLSLLSSMFEDAMVNAFAKNRAVMLRTLIGVFKRLYDPAKFISLERAYDLCVKELSNVPALKRRFESGVCDLLPDGKKGLIFDLIRKAIKDGDRCVEATRYLLSICDAYPSELITDQVVRDTALGGHVQTLKFFKINNLNEKFELHRYINPWSILPVKSDYLRKQSGERCPRGTLLAQACAEDLVAVVRHLLSLGASINIDFEKDVYGYDTKKTVPISLRSVVLDMHSSQLLDVFDAHCFMGMLIEGSIDFNILGLFKKRCRDMEMEYIEEAIENILFKKLREKTLDPSKIHQVLKSLFKLDWKPEHRKKLLVFLSNELYKLGDNRAVLFASLVVEEDVHMAKFVSKSLMEHSLTKEDNKALIEAKITFLNQQLLGGYLEVDSEAILAIRTSLKSDISRGYFDTFVRSQFQSELLQYAKFHNVNLDVQLEPLRPFEKLGDMFSKVVRPSPSQLVRVHRIRMIEHLSLIAADTCRMVQDTLQKKASKQVDATDTSPVAEAACSATSSTSTDAKSVPVPSPAYLPPAYMASSSTASTSSSYSQSLSQAELLARLRGSSSARR